MVHTANYEHLLDLENVTAVDYDPDTDTVTAYVTTKKDLSDLDESQVVSNVVTDKQTDVKEIGVVELESMEPSSTAYHRPVKAGVSEGPVARNSAGTCGLLARVVDPSALPQNWSDDVEPNTLVRLSNNHVYASVAFEPGLYDDVIVQPARYDSGTQSDAVGRLVGYVPLIDGGHVDVAARSVDHPEMESNEVAAEGQELFDPNDFTVLRDDQYAAAKRDGLGLWKVGRTTGYTSGDIEAVDASVNVNMGNGDTITFRHQIITTDMSSGGDSGSHVFTENGDLAGLLFAGSDSVTVLNRAENVEDEFGVQYGTEPIQEPDPPERIVTVKRENFGPVSIAYSFKVSGEVEVRGPGRSTSVVGNRVNAFLVGWSNQYHVTGRITDASFPENATVKVDGEEVEVDSFVRKEREQANTDSTRSGRDAWDIPDE